jgi:hypothetical protein
MFRRDPDCFPGQSKAKVAARYLAVRCFFLASARRSVFFRRFARFLALSLPLLCPIGFKTHLLAPSRHVVVSTKTESNGASGVSDMAGKAAKGSGRAWREQPRYKLAPDSASVLVVLRSRSFRTSHRTKPRPASALLLRSMRYWRGRVLNFGRLLIPRFRQRPGRLAASWRASRVACVRDLECPKEPRQINHVVRG